MNRVVIIPETEFDRLVARIEKLESLTAPPPEKPTERILNVREAANYLRMTPEGIRNARRQQRLRGFLLNEKCWGFHQSELERYKKRHHRL